MRNKDSISPWPTNFREYSLYASDFGHNLKYWENSRLFWRYKETQLGGLGWDKVRFTANVTTISFTLPHSSQYATIRFLRVRKLCEFKITGVYSRKAVQRKTATRQFLIRLKSYIILIAYIVTHQKSSCRGSKMWTKDIAAKYFLEVLRTNSPSVINHVL